MIASILGSHSHIWKFFRAGGTDQVRLDVADDLVNLQNLDQKLWVALSCPVGGLEFDNKTLELIDTDKDGRIRVPEIQAAVKWATSHLKKPEDLLQGSDSLPLSAINDATDSGKQLLASAKQILANLGKKDATAITLADTADTAKIFAQTKFNGDGIVPAESAEDAFTQAVIKDVIACLGSEADRSGLPGITQAKIDQFFTAAKAYSEWWAKAEADAAKTLPLGPNTGAAFDAFKAVRAKVDDYFTRCRLAAFDPRSATPLNRAELEFVTLAPKLFSASGTEVADFPVARIEANKPLPLVEGINPAWTAAISKFKDAAVSPLLGADVSQLTESLWARISSLMAAHEAWLGGKSGAEVEKLGLARVREVLSSTALDALSKLVAKDKALEPESTAISSVDRLIRYHRDLVTLLHNFVNFKDFYSGRKPGIFQSGTLYLDGRSCDLCIKVADMGKHASVATLSKTYVTYCDCTRKGSPQKITIAAAFTGGDSDQLMVGRNGVFYDRAGQDWDATIVKIIEHPISIRQAILAPYKRIGRMIGEQIEKVAAARDKEVQEKAAAQIASTAKAVEEKKPAPAAQPTAQGGVSNMVGVLAAVGLALGALSTAATSAFKTFADLKFYEKPLAILGIFILISGPSVVIAWLKLRQRNLGPLLDANGWAINGRMKINIPFGGALTGIATLPPNSERSLEDPFAEKSTTRNSVIIAGVLAITFGILHLAGVLDSLYKALGR